MNLKYGNQIEEHASLSFYSFFITLSNLRHLSHFQAQISSPMLGLHPQITCQCFFCRMPFLHHRFFCPILPCWPYHLKINVVVSGWSGKPSLCVDTGRLGGWYGTDVDRWIFSGQVSRLTWSGSTLMREEVNPHWLTSSHKESLIVIFGNFW